MRTVAKRAGISAGELSKIEHGLHQPTRDTLQGLAAALGCTFVLGKGTITLVPN